MSEEHRDLFFLLSVAWVVGLALVFTIITMLGLLGPQRSCDGFEQNIQRIACERAVYPTPEAGR